MPKGYTLRMRQLPKPEWELMKAMVAKYNLQDPSELLVVLLRLGNEVERYQTGTVNTGMVWLTRIIDDVRSQRRMDTEPNEDYVD